MRLLLLRLQVLIESRQGPVRNILNARELVDACNQQSASWPLDPASPIKRIQCRWVWDKAWAGYEGGARHIARPLHLDIGLLLSHSFVQTQVTS